jgi:hypothetical protein
MIVAIELLPIAKSMVDLLEKRINLADFLLGHITLVHKMGVDRLPLDPRFNHREDFVERFVLAPPIVGEID